MPFKKICTIWNYFVSSFLQTRSLSMAYTWSVMPWGMSSQCEQADTPYTYTSVHPESSRNLTWRLPACVGERGPGYRILPLSRPNIYKYNSPPHLDWMTRRDSVGAWPFLQPRWLCIPLSSCLLSRNHDQRIPPASFSSVGRGGLTQDCMWVQCADLRGRLWCSHCGSALRVRPLCVWALASFALPPVAALTHRLWGRGRDVTPCGLTCRTCWETAAPTLFCLKRLFQRTCSVRAFNLLSLLWNRAPILSRLAEFFSVTLGNEKL